jgi:peptidoglycan/xylan/chitin deacetylase (PgdA/CDA1 family)
VSLAHVPRHAIVEGIWYAVAGGVLLGGLALGAAFTDGAVRVALTFGVAAAIPIGLTLAWLYYPTFDPIGRCFHRAPAGRRQIAITFDDGPSEHSAAILDVLHEAGARATFFWIGERVRQRPDLVRRAIADGHAIGNHTNQHRKLPLASSADVEAQIAAAQHALREAGAGDVALFRAPHGFKSVFLGAALRRHGLRLIGWTRGIWDTDNPGADVIAERGIVDMEDGEVLLLHDGGGDRSQTVAALPRILEGARARGLQPVTIPELERLGRVDYSRTLAAGLVLAGIALIVSIAI